MTAPDCYLGLMSGTSMDAADAVVARFDAATGWPEILTTASLPAPPPLRARLLAAAAGQALPVAEFGRLDQAVGDWFADAARAAIATAGIEHGAIRAIGSHGQTLWHAPAEHPAFSIQIGAPARIAARTGCPVVADFRSADIAAGGQGAPLVCAFHAALFAHPRQPRVVANIGGIANLTLVPAAAHARSRTLRGFDTGPGNGLMDAWIDRHCGRAFDTDGAWAASGAVDAGLLSQLASTSYFRQPPPKSTGREYFGLGWLDRQLARCAIQPSPADVQATLCELTALTLANDVARYAPDSEEIYLCGGGVHNRHLCARIRAHAAPRRVTTTEELGLDPNWIEALAFAWLARCRLLGRPGNAPGVTGATGPAILGGVHLPPPDQAPPGS